MQSTERTIITVEHELEATQSWAARKNVDVSWHPTFLEIHAVLTQPETMDKFFLRGKVDNYKIIPPAWDFCDSSFESNGSKAHFPKGGKVLHGGGSIFILSNNHPVICAPFNRLAYKQHKGPHNWGELESWLTAGNPQNVRAETLADMLGVIKLHIHHSRGRMT